MNKQFTKPAKRVLITGITGFTGTFLADHLLQKGYDVYGTTLSKEKVSPHIFHCDITDANAVRTVVDRAQPDSVIHLAALLPCNTVYKADSYQHNLVGTAHLFEALNQHRNSIRSILVASSAMVYQNNSSNLTEDSSLLPQSDYALSKFCVEQLAVLWADRLPIVVTRPFNSTGIGHPKHYLIPKIIDHFVNRKPTITLGRLDIERDYSDVRCTVQIYEKLMDNPPHGQTVNLCSGMGIRIQDILNLCTEISGHQLAVHQDTKFMRASDPQRMVGCTKKLESIIGPIPQIPMTETLQWMYQSIQASQCA